LIPLGFLPRDYAMLPLANNERFSVSAKDAETQMAKTRMRDYRDNEISLNETEGLGGIQNSPGKRIFALPHSVSVFEQLLLAESFGLSRIGAKMRSR